MNDAVEWAMRPAAPQDAAFLASLFGSTRRELGFEEEARDAVRAALRWRAMPIQ